MCVGWGGWGWGGTRPGESVISAVDTPGVAVESAPEDTSFVASVSVECLGLESLSHTHTDTHTYTHTHIHTHTHTHTHVREFHRQQYCRNPLDADFWTLPRSARQYLYHLYHAESTTSLSGRLPFKSDAQTQLFCTTRSRTHRFSLLTRRLQCRLRRHVTGCCRMNPVSCTISFPAPVYRDKFDSTL